MDKTEKELAFLRDLYVETDWTERFTDLFDDNFKFSDEKKILYLNAGTGSHALALRKKLDDKIELSAVAETSELLSLARAKAEAVRGNVNFISDAPSDKFDAVFADASLTPPTEAFDLVAKATALSKKQVAFFAPTASSFGEIYSLFWETLISLDLTQKGAEIERLIIDLPTVSNLEAAARNSGLDKIETISKSEFFEYEDGAAFVNSPLAADFLFPAWLDFLTADEKTEFVEKLAAVIDEDSQGMSFQFSIKATLLVGEKTEK